MEATWLAQAILRLFYAEAVFAIEGKQTGGQMIQRTFEVECEARNQQIDLRRLRSRRDHRHRVKAPIVEYPNTIGRGQQKRLCGQLWFGEKG